MSDQSGKPTRLPAPASRYPSRHASLSLSYPSRHAPLSLCLYCSTYLLMCSFILRYLKSALGAWIDAQFLGRQEHPLGVSQPRLLRLFAEAASVLRRAAR